MERSISCWKQANALTPEHLCDEQLSALPADRAVLAHWAHDVTFVVPNLSNTIWEMSNDR
jgi:hypothetical protein